jgi:hypothetical protein
MTQRKLFVNYSHVKSTLPALISINVQARDWAYVMFLDFFPLERS